jgi:hypothetical protein
MLKDSMYNIDGHFLEIAMARMVELREYHGFAPSSNIFHMKTGTLSTKEEAVPA